jgi:cell division protein FtsX
MALPLKVNLRGLFRRRTATLLTVAGMSLMVMIFAIAWSLDAGLRSVFEIGGSPDLLIVLREGSSAETNSYVPRDDEPIITSVPGIALDPASGEPIASAEAVTILNQPRRGQPGQTANVIVRGLGPRGFSLRPQFRLVEGRPIQPGLDELLASKAMAQRFEGCGLGETLRIRRTPFKVVGLFEAQGSPYESEMWADKTDLGAATGRDGASIILLKVPDALDRERVKAAIEGDSRLNCDVKSQQEYFAKQTESAQPLAILGGLLTFFLSVGACFAAANTMHAAVLARAKEIGTLRALGFSRLSVMTCYVLESVVLSLGAGVVGLLLASLVLAFQSGYAGTSNWTTFSEVAFRLKLTLDVVKTVMITSVIIGLLGGLFPAWRAARLPVVDALRA